MTGFSRSELPAPSTRTAAPSNPPGQGRQVNRVRKAAPSTRSTAPSNPPGQGRSFAPSPRSSPAVAGRPDSPPGHPALESTRTAASARSAPPVRAVHVGHQLRGRNPPGQGRPRIHQDNRQVNRVREGRTVHQDSRALESTRTRPLGMYAYATERYPACRKRSVQVSTPCPPETNALERDSENRNPAP